MIDVTRTEIVFGRMSSPSFYARPKLTPAQREQIAHRRGDGDSLTTLAREYGVSTSVIATIAPRDRP